MWIHRLLLFCFLSLSAVGQYLALYWVPSDRLMGNVYRILYVHVPSAWLCLVAFTGCFIGSIGYLYSSWMVWDFFAASSAEVGLLLNTILLITGSIWGKPTWGVYWTWDPRLTTAAILWFAYAAYLLMRHFIADSERRATLAAVLAILIYVDVPIVYFSVKWWSSLHQEQSSPQTVAAIMVMVLRINAFAFLSLYAWLTHWLCSIYAQQYLQENEQLSESRGS
jgi:heme exporter protein C